MQSVGPDTYAQSFSFGVTVGVVVTNAGLILIDAPTAPTQARAWLAELNQFNRPLLYLINLDHHRDRTFNNQWFDAPVIAHELTHERTRVLPEIHRAGTSYDLSADDELFSEPIGGRLVLPTFTFTDQMTLLTGGRALRLTHHPGHTPGAIWAELPEAGVIFTGDTITHRATPFLHEADPNRWLDDLADLRKRKNPTPTVVPGRGAPMTKEQLRNFEEAMKTVRRKVETLVKNHRPRHETHLLVTELMPLFATAPEYRPHFARRLTSGLDRLYDVLAEQPRPALFPRDMPPASP